MPHLSYLKLYLILKWCIILKLDKLLENFYSLKLESFYTLRDSQCLIKVSIIANK